MKHNLTPQQKLLESIISDPNFYIKSNIRAIDEQVKQRKQRRSLNAPLTPQEKIFFKH